jgi:hypothetical protein
VYSNLFPSFTFFLNCIVSLNEFCSDKGWDDSDENCFNRGDCLFELYEYFEMDYSYIVEHYGHGFVEDVFVTESENYTFEYTGNKKYTTDFMGENEFSRSDWYRKLHSQLIQETGGSDGVCL